MTNLYEMNSRYLVCVEKSLCMLSKDNCMKMPTIFRAPDYERNFISKMHISLSNPMFDHLLESSRCDNSNKWSNIGFGEEITQIELIEVIFTHWSTDFLARRTESRGSYCRTPGVRRQRQRQRRRPHLVKVSL